ncbi:MAG: heme exporter protein CcmD [Moraxellaceae bacterium]|nr:heme exporter protein CcmD [Moraxellaceae bacterium]
MNWDSLAGFLAMGGRGAFVWGSYGVTLLCVLLELWLLKQGRRQGLRALWRRQQIDIDEAAAMPASQDNP